MGRAPPNLDTNLLTVLFPYRAYKRCFGARFLYRVPCILDENDLTSSRWRFAKDCFAVRAGRNLAMIRLKDEQRFKEVQELVMNAVERWRMRNWDTANQESLTSKAGDYLNLTNRKGWGAAENMERGCE